MTKRKPKAGFTLMELLVVVGILAILSAILLAVIVRARDKGAQAVCVHNLNQLYKYLVFYTDENDGLLPRLEGTRWIGDLIVNNDRTPPPEILKCPADRRPMTVSVYELSYACNCTWSKRALSSIRKPSSVVLFADIGRSDTGRVKFCARYAWVFKRYNAYRHFGQLQALFADGHVDSLTPGECTEELFKRR